MSRVNIQVDGKNNVDIVVNETPAEDFEWEVTRSQALSETVPPLAIMKANEEVSKIYELESLNLLKR